MDTTKWKKVLLQWITECGFMERSYFNIEQTDIEAFFRSYYQHLHVKETGDALPGKNLSCFLQEQYPEFQAHFEDNSVLCSADFLYVYSLLLHFSCVKYPEEYFHKICQKLPEPSQQRIAAFFKLLLDCSDMTRETLRQAIAEVTQSSPRTTNDSFTMSGSVDMPSTSDTEHSMKTPRRPPTQRLSPPTPKTYLLEERTRELYSLRASLETERYEKGLLEVQIKQNEEKICKLNQDHRKLQLQIQELKNDILTRNAENSTSPKRDSDEQIKRRLCKEISQKEQEIAKLSDILNTLKEEKGLLQEQLNYAKQQVVACLDRIKELDYKVDELRAEIEQKNGTIKYLTDNKLELERFIAETCAATNTERLDLNASIDCFEGSFSRDSNSSGSQNSPENLALSVIDVQFRETELENRQLREALTNMRVSNNRLGRQMQQIIQRHAEECQLQTKNITVNDNEYVDPAEHFVLFASCVEELAKRCKNEQNTVKKLQQDALAVQKHNETLYQRVQQFESDVAEMKACTQKAESINRDLEIARKESQEKLNSCEQELEALQQQRLDMIAKFDALSREYEVHKGSCQVIQNELSTKLANIQSELVCKTSRIESLEGREKQLEQMNNELQTKLNTLYDKFQSKTIEYDLEVKSLSERLASSEQELKTHVAAEISVKDKYEKLLIAGEDMKRKARDADQHLDAMRNEIAIKEMEMKKLGAEIVDVHKKNSELEERIDTVMLRHKRDLQNSDLAINKKEEVLKMINYEKDKLQQQLEEVRKMHKQNQDHTMKMGKDLQETSGKIGELLILCKPLFSEQQRDGIEDRSQASALADIIEHVKLLLEESTRSAAEIECLQFERLQFKKQLYDAEKTLQNALQQKEELIDQQSVTINECKAEVSLAEERIHGYETKLDMLKQQQANFIQNIEKQLQLHLTDKSSNLTQLQQLEKQRQAETEDYARLERELILVIAEHNSVKLKLIETENENTQLREKKDKAQLAHAEKINEFSVKLLQLEQENAHLVTEISNFKHEHSRIEVLLKKANTALEELSGQLSAETLSKSQLDLKLQHNETRMMETEKKLQSILEEKSSSLSKLQTTYEDQAANLENALEKIEKLEQLKSTQATQIEEQSSELIKLLKENEQFREKYSGICTQMEREQSEKAVLLRSLEKTADQLKLAVDAKGQETAVLEKRCSDLQAQYNASVKLNERLQSEMASRETEWTLQLDEIECERTEMQSKLGRKIAEQAEQQEAIDLALTETITVLESITQQNPVELATKSNVFNAADDGSDNDQMPHHNKLRLVLNKFIRRLTQLQEQENEVARKCKEANEYVEVLTKANEKLSAQLTRSKSESLGLHNLLTRETKPTESNLGIELQRLKDDITNADRINEKLSAENADLQYKRTCLEEEMANAQLTISILTEEQKKLKQRNCSMQTSQTHHENEMQEKSDKIYVLEEELRKSNEFVSRLKKQLSKLQLQTSSHLSETRELSEKVCMLQDENDKLESDLNSKKQENAALQAQVEEAAAASRLQLQEVGKRLEDAIANRLASENKCTELNAAIDQLKNYHKSAEVRLETAQNEQRTLTDNVDALRSEKTELSNELREVKRELQRSMDNVTELIQQIASIRLEKEAVLEENQELRKQVEENSKCHSSTEAKLKSIMERSQALELSLVSAESDLKSIRAHLEKSEQNIEKLSADNKKLRETNEAATKRVEKMALKLGDAQARGTKLERDNEKLTKTIEANTNLLDALQREKDAVQSENKSIKERLSRMERTQEQLTSKVQTLEKTNTALEEAKVKLEAAELDVKSKLLKLEKMRESNEEKIRKLNHSLNISEKSNVRLNLEIGALNSQLGEVRRTASEERLGQTEQVHNKLVKAEEQVHHFEQRCAELEKEAEQLRFEKSHIAEQLSKASLSLQSTKEKCDLLGQEMQQLRNDVEELRTAKQRLDAEHKASVSLLRQQEEHQKALLAEQQALVTELEENVAKMNTELTTKTALLENVEAEVKQLRQRLAEKQETTEEAVAKYVTELEAMRTRLSEAEELLVKEQSITSQLETDNQILQAKYREAKERFTEENRLSEERIKENRLELEGKLEKMKNKMKSLYTEEITKMKAKQEREMAVVKTELGALKAQNVKYEDHTRKLSSQIMLLNESILEYRKQNAILTTNIKHLEGDSRFKKPAPTHVSSSSNLVMEDEEGEVFNNTYLADLKSGRMPELMGRNICPEELQYRNSLLPPHLQSTYAAQYDHGLTEEELKDGPNSLDDSLSALLSTTTGGVTRKKVCGATSYKRPGPPTPSKNGGRLSFGGNSEPAREILKESYDSNGEIVTSSSKTPARFKIFSSRFSIGSVKDENSPPRRRLSNMFKRK